MKVLVGFGLVLVGGAVLLSLATPQVDPVDPQTKFQLNTLRPLLPMFFDDEAAAPFKSVLSPGGYHDVTDEFGKAFEQFASESRLSYRFDASHHLLSAADDPVRVEGRLDATGQVSMRFVAPSHPLHGFGKAKDIEVEHRNLCPLPATP